MYTVKMFYEVIKIVVLASLLLGVILGAAWMQWAGYQERHPQGGCLGFITRGKH